MASAPPSRSRKAAKWASVVVLTIAGAYFLLALSAHWTSIPPIQWGYSALLALAATVLCVLFNLALGGLMWKSLLSDQGINLPASTSCRIVGMSQVGKYLPGNVGHMVGQVALAKAAGVPVGVSVTSLLISTLWLVAIGLAMGGAGLVVFLDSNEWVHLPVPHPIWLVMLGLAVVVSPWLGLWTLNQCIPKLSRWLGQGQLVSLPRFRTAAFVASGFVVCFFVFGIMLKLQAVYLFNIQEGSVWAFTFLFTSAWIAGYLLPGAPGGLGVREAITIALFSPLVGAGAAVGLSVTMRLATVLGDGLAFVAGILIQWLKLEPSART